MKLLALLIAGFMFTATPVMDDKLIEINREFELGVKETGNLRTECLNVEFDSVLEDSRCPTGVDCIWSGNAVVRLRISKNGQDEQQLDLNTHIQPSSRSYKGYEVSLKGLSPYPSEGSAINKESYKALLLIKSIPAG